jgi:putative peptide zinc metalloprotease protein
VRNRRPAIPDDEPSVDTKKPESSSNGPVNAKPPTTRQPPKVPDPPHLADGVQLQGEFEGSGFKEGRFLVKRGDGQIIQLDKLMYLIVEHIDGRRSLDEIGELVSEKYGRTVSGGNVATLIGNNLYRDGIVPGPDGKVPQLKKVDPMLRLKMRMTLLPEGPVNAVAGLLKPLFWPPVIVAVLVAFVATDIWYFVSHGVGQGLRDTLYQPITMLLLYSLLILSIGWHELGHATACKYSGARPGKIGFGIYVIWPAFFTDVTEVYTLGKAGRVRTDLGGVYFNAIFTIAVAGVYFLTGFEPILVLILMQHLLILYNFMPMLRMDGYFVIADSTGVPDLFARMKPVLKSMHPKKEAPKEVTELKQGVRRAVTVWVLLALPVLFFVFTMMVIHAPRLLATTWDSFFVQKNKISAAMSDGSLAQAAVGGIQTAMLLLPVGGMGLTAFNVSKRIGRGVKNLAESRPALGMAIGAVCGAGLMLAAFVLWPNGDYRPIQREERWTAAEAVERTTQIPTGRPGLTEEQEEELGGAPALAPQGLTPEDEEQAGPESETGSEPTPQPSATAGSESRASPEPTASP